MEDLAWRFISLIDSKELPDVTLYRACVNGLSGIMETSDLRATFIEKLNTLFKENHLAIPNTQPTDSLIIINNKITLPSTRSYVVDSIDQVLLLHKFAAETPSLSVSYKRGVVLIGPPGIGKSTLLQERLEEKGYLNANSPEAQQNPKAKKYYLISAGSQNVKDTLAKAAKENAPVILDELNVDTELEKPLIDFLEKGLLFTSQNPGHFKGRSTSLLAIMSRLNVINTETYTDTELQLMASKYSHGLVPVFRKAQKEKPVLNDRSFFTVLKLIEEKEKKTPQATSSIQQNKNKTPKM